MQTNGTDALTSLRSFLEDLGNTIVIARTLIEDGYQVDLKGFDVQVGLLCAKALDLPPEQGRLVRPDLVAFLSAADSLAGRLSAPELGP